LNILNKISIKNDLFCKMSINFIIFMGETLMFSLKIQFAKILLIKIKLLKKIAPTLRNFKSEKLFLLISNLLHFFFINKFIIKSILYIFKHIHKRLIINFIKSLIY
jgi:hypothetical protein